MLSRVSQQIGHKMAKGLAKQQARAFSHGPYNPLVYKTHIVPEELPT
jgi:hypothetical protein